MKLSFTCTLLRLIQTRLQYAVLFVLMITGAIITTATIIQAVLYCKPTSYYWNQFGNPNAKGHCGVYSSRTVIVLVQAVWILFADVVLGLIIPFMLLHGTMMHFRTKLSIHVLLGLSSMSVAPTTPTTNHLLMNAINSTCITTTIRLVYLSLSSESTLTWTVVPVVFWSLIEHGMNILCVAASTWKPLFVKMGLVDPRDRDSSVRMNTADREILGGSTPVRESNTNTNTPSPSRWSAPIAGIFYDREKKVGVGKNSFTLSSASSRGDGVV